MSWIPFGTRQHQERSYVLALAGVPRWEGMYYGVGEDGRSFLLSRGFR